MPTYIGIVLEKITKLQRPTKFVATPPDPILPMKTGFHQPNHNKKLHLTTVKREKYPLTHHPASSTRDKNSTQKIHTYTSNE